MNGWAAAGRAFFWGRMAVGAALILVALLQVRIEMLFSPGMWASAAVFLTANILANFYPIRLRQLEFTVSGVILVGAILLFDEPIPVMLAVIPSVAADLSARKEWYRTVFNAYGDGTSVFIAQTLFAAVATTTAWNLDSVRDLVGLGVLVISFYIFSALPPTLMVALSQKRPILHILTENIQPIYMDFCGTVMFGVLTGFVWHLQWKLALILVALGVVIYRAFQLATKLTHETETALKTIVDVVDARDEYTFNPSLLVAHYSQMVAERMGRGPSQVQ